MRRLPKALAAAGLAVALAIGAAAPSAAQSGDSDLLTFYYEAPQPDRLPAWLAGYDAEDWGAYPPLAGFLAVVFDDDPGEIERLTPAAPSPKMAATIAAALRLSGNAARTAEVMPPNQRFDRKLTAEYHGLPSRLSAIRIVSATHLDILWGASFASGDGRHVRKILDVMAATANRSEAIALDVAGVMIAMAGGPPEPLETLRHRYGNDEAYRIVLAATALWALLSNAQQHPFVEAAIGDYLRKHRSSHAGQVLAIFFEPG